MKQEIEAYLNQIESLEFQEISPDTWQTIQIEGIDTEFNLLNQKYFQESILKISLSDKKGLSDFKDEIIEKFNAFDWELKERFSMKYIDLIEYSLGIVKIIKIIKI